VKRALLASVVPIALLGGALATRALLAHAPARIAPDLAQAWPIVTAWGSFGGAVFTILALTLSLAAAAAFAFARSSGAQSSQAGSSQTGSLPAGSSLPGSPQAEASRDRPSTRGSENRAAWITWCAAVAALAAAFAWPVAYSSDVYAYAAYGELALRGLDPYVRVAPAVHGPFIDAARWQWSGTFPACVYGSAFVAISEGVVSAAGSHGVAFGLFAFRALAALAWLADVFLFRLLARAWFPAREGAALALFALNPLGIWCAAEGHNDALMLLPVLLGLVAVSRGALFAGGLAIGLTPLIKAAGAAAGPVIALSIAAASGVRRSLALWIGYAGGLGVAALLLVPQMWPALTSLQAHGAYAPRVSLQSVAGLVPALVLAAATSVAGLRALARGEATGALWLALAVLLALPNPYPWYMMWILPVAAAERGPAAAWLWCATVVGCLRYLPDAVGPLTNDANAIVTTAALVPLALLAVQLVRPAPAPREAALSL
jgi:hypothetical protein